MAPLALWVMFAAFAAAAVLTWLIRRSASARGALDVPNHRSSHAVPTPRGGGLAIVLVVTGAAFVLLLCGKVRVPLFCALAGGLAVAAVGFVDDRGSLAARVRLTVHFAAALWALMWLGGLPPLQMGDAVVSSGWFGYVLGALGIVWAINLFNFMDGIDGIAASEAIFIALAGALLSQLMGVGVGVLLMAGALAAACGGFLLWNWPPARIFLGDVGSGYLGYVVVVLAIAAGGEHPAALWVWLVLGGAFFVDATVTLVRRAFRGEHVHQAHRSHAYQRLAHRWGSHRTVTLGVLAVNLGWLLPCGLIAATHRSIAVTVVIIGFVPLACLAVLTGAGSASTASPKH
jgi:Fuc2NAc and GlcNAc transferase